MAASSRESSADVQIPDWLRTAFPEQLRASIRVQVRPGSPSALTLHFADPTGLAHHVDVWLDDGTDAPCLVAWGGLRFSFQVREPAHRAPSESQLCQGWSPSGARSRGGFEALTGAREVRVRRLLIAPEPDPRRRSGARAVDGAGVAVTHLARQETPRRATKPARAAYDARAHGRGSRPLSGRGTRR